MKVKELLNLLKNVDPEKQLYFKINVGCCGDWWETNLIEIDDTGLCCNVDLEPPHELDVDSCSKVASIRNLCKHWDIQQATFEFDDLEQFDLFQEFDDDESE